MQENYLITIEGTVAYGDDTDTVSLTTVGSFHKKGDKYYISYKESEATGFEGGTTTLKAWGDTVSMMRFKGGLTSNMTIEKGAVNICSYPTPMGPIIMDIHGVDMNNGLTASGGQLSISYSLNSGGMLISDNTVNVTVKEIN